MNRWLHRWLRWRYPKALKHMADIHPRFTLRDHADGGRTAHWHQQTVAQLTPLQPLRASQRSESCYVLASGPSVADLDLGFIGDRALFGVNGAIAKLLRSDAALPRFSHYVITDPDFVENRFELVRAVFAARPHLFLSAAAMSAICEREPMLLGQTPVSLIETHFCPYGKPRLSPAEIEALVARAPALTASSWRIGFSRDMELGLFSAHTVAYYALQIAAYIGFRNVFMLGTDFGSRGEQVRFYEGQGSARPSRMARDFDKFIRPSFEVLQQVCAADPTFQVYNLAADSRLPATIIPKLTPAESLRLCESNLTVGSR